MAKRESRERNKTYDVNRYRFSQITVMSKAQNEMRDYVLNGHSTLDKELVDVAYGITTKYSEASAALAAEYVENIARKMAGEKGLLADKPVVPAETATYEEVSKAISAVGKENVLNTPQVVGRFVKQAGADTVMLNGIERNAQFAWVPSGQETCAFCLMLAANGWVHISKKKFNRGNPHADHIHANCDCVYALRFDENTQVKGYDPKKYQDMAEEAIKRAREQGVDGKFYGTYGGTMQPDSINALRRMLYHMKTNPEPAFNRVAVEKDIMQNGPRFGGIKSLLIKLANADVEYKPAEVLKEALTKEEIVAKLAGPDRTKGSCASLAYSYIANRGGLDVTDYRGGNSRAVFSQASPRFCEHYLGDRIDGLDDYKTANKVLQLVRPEKEYFFRTGSHAAIVRRNAEDALEYLELQGYDHGWKPLDDSVLKQRFGAKRAKKYAGYSILIDADKFIGDDYFRDIVGYINTATEAQQKGYGGGIR